MQVRGMSRIRITAFLGAGNFQRMYLIADRKSCLRAEENQWLAPRLLQRLDDAVVILRKHPACRAGKAGAVCDGIME